jgi:LuxR family maltose regulon positive regulatory protein
MLESLERSNRFVVALDRDRGWYRCHHLVRELLAAELARSEPDLVSPLLHRAFDWCMANGQEAVAIRYGQAEGDPDRIATAMTRVVQPVYQSGRITTVAEWFGWLAAHGDPRRYPAVAVIGALFHAATGRPTESDRWAAAAEHGSHAGPLPDGTASIDGWRALLRAFRCRGGSEAMRADAALAVRTLAPASPWHPLALVLHGLSELLNGSIDAADDVFADAADEAAQLGAPNMIPLALAERAVIAITRGEWARADDFATRAVWAARHSRLEDSAPNALVYAVAARTAAHGERTESARELMALAQRRLPQLTYALPVPAVQTRLELARTCLALADPAGASVMLRDIDPVLRRCPDLGTFPSEAAELRARVSPAGPDARGASTLTLSELGVLPLLTTHLTFKEIGERRHLSRHTVKSHAMSIYRKLGATSRSAAVERARELGLL